MIWSISTTPYGENSTLLESEGIGKEGRVTLLEHTKLGETFESHFATKDFFTRAPE